MKIEFTVPGQPVAKARPRFARRGNFVTTYTPEKTANYETTVKIFASAAMVGHAPINRPVCMMVNIYMQIPASWSKRKQFLANCGMVAATKKPDADNILKILKDACNGIVWVDDAQVIEIHLYKRYSDTPRAEVVIEEFSDAIQSA